MLLSVVRARFIFSAGYGRLRFRLTISLRFADTREWNVK